MHRHNDNEGFFLSEKSSKAGIREAVNARENRGEIVKAYSQGQVSRRDLIKLGLITTGGLLMPVHGLNPFVNSAFGSLPTGAPPSPLFGAVAFSQAMPRFDVLPRLPVTALTPTPQAQANQTLQPVDPALGGGFGPVEGRPPGAIWAHQG